MAEQVQFSRESEPNILDSQEEFKITARHQEYFPVGAKHVKSFSYAPSASRAQVSDEKEDPNNQYFKVERRVSERKNSAVSTPKAFKRKPSGLRDYLRRDAPVTPLAGTGRRFDQFT